ncbi:hypothetical protein NC653_041351 [Populus alba x Populus x berolinensis]|uniref:Uncharacterized protein n=1 Tax=Populus alba x Populus x berolinensis TaxID=444605 RepID=A0AAD6L894_9ROSI|nr:hypothetical protein NC653_041351 [Populus alba x Populus x berolinensis]
MAENKNSQSRTEKDRETTEAEKKETKEKTGETESRGDREQKKERGLKNKKKKQGKEHWKREHNRAENGKETDPEQEEQSREPARKKKTKTIHGEEEKNDEKLRGRQGQFEAKEREGKIPSQLRQPQTTNENRGSTGDRSKTRNHSQNNKNEEGRRRKALSKPGQ